MVPILVLGIIILFSILIEIAHCSVYGKFIPEKDLDNYLSKHLIQYQLNEIAYSNRNGKLMYHFTKPYIATSSGILTKWHISDVGTIPRWSKWSKKLDKYYNDLPKPNIKKSLADYN